MVGDVPARFVQNVRAARIPHGNPWSRYKRWRKEEKEKKKKKKRAQKKKEDMRLPSHSMLLLKVGIPRGRKTSRQLAIDDVAFQEGIAMVHDIGTSAQHYILILRIFSVFLPEENELQ